MTSKPGTIVETDIHTDKDVNTSWKLIVYNDDVNSFNWVIESFCKVLKIESIQAEQLALMIHTKGQTTVKSGEYDKMRWYKEGLTDRGLDASVEE